MSGRLIIVTGTGTGIGKTHIACALLRRAGRARRVLGYKPVESGLGAASASDADRLSAASSFHVKQLPGLRLDAALSPHLAARLERKRLDWDAVARFVVATRSSGIDVLIELPGGLFTPLEGRARNVDRLMSLEPTATLLLAPDRLGVLHDVGAALAGAAHLRVAITAVGLVTPEVADMSTCTNAAELSNLVDVPVLAVWPRGTEEELSSHVATDRGVRLWLREG